MREVKNQKSKIAYVNFSASENSSTQILATNTIIHHEKTYYCHPIYTNYGCSTDGYIINSKRLIPRKGYLNSTGYLETSVYSNGKHKTYEAHRMVFEAVNQQIIPDGMQIHHINCDKQDNSIENLELVTRKENMKYEAIRLKGVKRSKKQNVEIKCNKFYYHKIYTNFGANKYGQIYNKKKRELPLEIYNQMVTWEKHFHKLNSHANAF